jgi:ribonuclease HI
MKTKKYYVVWQGRKTGIFTTWAECEQQIHKFSGARYKSFPSKAEAELAFQNQSSSDNNSLRHNQHQVSSQSPSIIAKSICVDASCLGNPGILEYQGVDTASGEVLFRQGPLNNGTNNIGEFLAIVHGLAYLQTKGESKTPIYSDSSTAILWVKNKKVKTTLKATVNNQEVFERLNRALNWLQNNDYANPILKWDTSSWGEIPADFGRK